MRFKIGCSLRDLQPQTVLAMYVCDEVYREHGEPMTITSVNDGAHMTGSYHYQGKAFDVRTKSIDSGKRQIVEEVKRRLVPLGFDVVFEGADQLFEHIHVEHDPK